jgi:hypothetical protein
LVDFFTNSSGHPVHDNKGVIVACAPQKRSFEAGLRTKTFSFEQKKSDKKIGQKIISHFFNFVMAAATMTLLLQHETKISLERNF